MHVRIRPISNIPGRKIKMDGKPPSGILSMDFIFLISTNASLYISSLKMKKMSFFLSKSIFANDRSCISSFQNILYLMPGTSSSISGICKPITNKNSRKTMKKI